MRNVVGLLALAATLGSGCYASVLPPTQQPPTSVTTWGPWGGMSINSPACAGQVALNNGITTVSDSCFTGGTNVVLCTDTTAANPVRCAPALGTLAVSGNGSDVIAYARVR